MTTPDYSSTLEATLRDGTLTRKEGRLLRALIAELRHDRERLAQLRNTAFRLAGERIERDPVGTLKWLGKVDKIIDNAARQSDDTPRPRVAFAPGDGGLSLILTTLREARRTADICVFTITDDRITGAILDAAERGVAVRIVTDNDKRFDSGSDIHRLARSGIAVRYDPDEDHMHHKFAIVDETTLITGSYNWTRGATRNHENVLLLNDPPLIRHHRDEFERLWRAFAY